MDRHQDTDLGGRVVGPAATAKHGGLRTHHSAPRFGLLGLALAASLAACTPIETGHGYIPTAEELAALTPGSDTRATVAAAIGRPAMTGALDDESWFYVRSTYRQSGVAPPQEISREIVALSFDDAGRLANVERLGLEDARAVAITRRVTDSGVRSVGLVDQLGRNLGRISADQVLAQP